MKTVLNNLLNLNTETEIVEFKEAKSQFDKDKLGRYFSALANEANLAGKPNGWLLLGIKNNQTIIGTSISEIQLNEYKAEMVKHTSPRSNFSNTHRVKQEGKEVILLEIPPAPKGQPVSWKGHFYGRDGESLGALLPNEYDAIKSQIITTDWSAEIIESATISDLSEEAIAEARVQFTLKNKKIEDQIKEWSDTVFLNKAKITIKNKITRTAILLLGKSESDHFISPATSKITWILKDGDNVEKDYEHFSCPLLLNINEVYRKIRNLKYRYINDGTLFPEEVEQYHPYIIREALNNCIAHQDYTLGGKILVVENESAILTFSNSGNFIPKDIETVIKTDAPESKYRNKFLADAMVNLNMIDTIGSGIKKMYNIQRKKYFPLPDYEFSNNNVKVSFIGKVVDINYARKLAQMPNLTLEEIMMLDKVPKNKMLNDGEIKLLKSKKLIEGRKPNFHISSKVASATGEKVDYIRLKGFDEDYYGDLIIKYLEQFEKAKKRDITDLLINKLPSILSEKQKEDKIKNLLQKMKKEGKIKVDENRFWVLDLDEL